MKMFACGLIVGLIIGVVVTVGFIAVIVDHDDKFLD